MLAIIAIGACWLPAAKALRLLSDYAHLVLMYPLYTTQIVKPDKRTAGTETFDWGAEGLVAGGSTERYLIHDLDGKLDKEIGVRPMPRYPEASIDTKWLIGSFYIRELNYP